MVFCLRFMVHGELSSCSSGHSGCCSPGFGEKESSKYGLGFSHAALSSNNIPAGLSKTASDACCYILGCLGRHVA